MMKIPASTPQPTTGSPPSDSQLMQAAAMLVERLQAIKQAETK